MRPYKGPRWTEVTTKKVLDEIEKHEKFIEEDDKEENEENEEDEVEDFDEDEDYDVDETETTFEYTRGEFQNGQL